MNRVALFSILALAVVLVIGFYVYDQAENTSTEISNTAEDTWNDTSELPQETAGEIDENVNFNDREMFFSQIEARVNELEQEVSAGTDTANEEIRQELADLRDSYDRAKQATEDEWEEARSNVVTAYRNTFEGSEELPIAE